MYQPLLPLFLAGLAFTCGGLSSSTTHHKDPVTTVYQSSNNTFIENQLVLPNGHLLFTTLNSGDVFSLDPYAAQPVPKRVVSFPGTLAVTGITSLGNGLYAATAGVQEGLAFHNMALHVFKLDGTLISRIPGPDPSLLNGIATLPTNPNIVLSADSYNGQIIRFNTKTKTASVAVSAAEEPELAAGDLTLPLPEGVNGIKIRGGYLYFTNTYLGTFGRFRIDAFDGRKVGRVEILARLEQPTGFGRAYDDFVLDGEGNAYITQHYNTIVKVCARNKAVSVVPGTGRDDGKIHAPTAVAFSKDGSSLFVTTASTSFTGTAYSGGVFSIKLDEASKGGKLSYTRNLVVI
ncbi:hypothetical protein B0H66DRAFT_596800 [Apodospora peruviana]|uniref:SMP-30/Gluconolactonase/LRE-like region domain-containing protein n=1 Tax=Apodospora peruviana TaxID=516989 RepID=A0AAE0IPX6_9PEZI|nr:hypothetical protein B0H66DRAFT_596800 [Apodospora peruviana]